MWIPVLGLVLALQGGTLPSARFLPKATTLFAASVAAPETLWKHRAKIAQLGIWERERMRAPFLFFAQSQKDLARAVDAVPGLGRWLGAFDRGLTAAALFTPRAKGQEMPGRMRPEPRLYFVGAASEARRTRGLDGLVAEMLGAGTRKSIAVDYAPILDSPVRATIHSLVTPNQGWRGAPRLTHVVKGKFVGVTFSLDYGEKNEERDAEFRKHRVAAVASSIGLGGRARGGATLDQRLQLPDDATQLARVVLRVRDNLRSPEHGPSGDLATAGRASGLWEWEGVHGTLFLDANGEPRTRTEIHFGPDEHAASFLECFRGNARGSETRPRDCQTTRWGPCVSRSTRSTPRSGFVTD